MKTEVCRLKLKNFLIEIEQNKNGWPISKIENTCSQLFGESNERGPREEDPFILMNIYNVFFKFGYF